MEFKKKEVAAKFEIVGDHNPRIAIDSYDGPLADAPLKVVEGMVKRKNSLVKEKAATAPAEKAAVAK